MTRPEKADPLPTGSSQSVLHDDSDTTGNERRHAPRGAVRAFAESIVACNDIDSIVAALATFSCRTWGWSHPLTARRETVDTAHVIPIAESATQELVLPADHPLIATLSRRRQALSSEELARSEHPGERQAAQLCEQNGWHICTPLGPDSPDGLFLLFRRAPDCPPTAADLDLLDALAVVVAAAIANLGRRDEVRLLRDALRRAERLSALGTLSAGVAHEIRNQMVTIQTFVQLLPSRLDDPEFLTSFLALAHDEVQRITALVGELLTFARSSDTPAATEDSNDLIGRSFVILEPEAKKRQIALRYDLGNDAPAFVGNGDKIRQVLTNLILNGLQATPPGGQVSVTTRAAVQGEESRLHIEIRDNGPGIASDQLEKIFTPFFTTKEEGTGLGLSIALDIIRQHDGEIRVESELGKGTCFLIDLPAAP